MKRTLIALLVCLPAFGAEVLTNADVLRLVRAGVSADVILLKIDQSAANFDTSTGALVELKSAGTPDAVLKAMLLKQPTATPTPAPSPAESRCTAVSYYTNGTGGWAWYPASVCVDDRGISIDEQVLALSAVAAQCVTKPAAFPFGDGNQELWLATSKETFKLRANADVIRNLSAAITRVLASAPHGDCGDRSLRRLFPSNGR